uniref:RNA-directed DNA polymerase n=2 Tax=Trichogramma kaykai TaxID=54128 RepID=A0ABD2X4Y4_9HYME
MCVNFRVDGGDNLVPFILEKRSHPPIMIVRQLFDDEPAAVADRTSEFATRILRTECSEPVGKMVLVPDEAQLRAKVAAIKNISSEQRVRITSLLYRYRARFDEAPGRFKSFMYKLRIQDTSPYQIKSYPIPIAHRAAVAEEIARMLWYDIIERSYSQYVNPIVAVVKKNNIVRLCLDARELNKRLDNDHDGPEKIRQVLKKWAKIGIMSSVDLRASFWQIPLHPGSRKFTAFMHAGKTYHFKVVPFGLKISTAALARAAEPILRDMGDYVFDYVDDWLVISRDVDEHIRHLGKLFETMERENITANFDKLELFRNEIKYVGHVITNDGIYPDPEKIDLIRHFPAPKNVKQVQGFLGMINFLSCYTDRIAFEAQPLLELTKKGNKWHWTAMEDAAFERVKSLFCKHAFLHHPLRHKPYVLMTDASTKALGAALCQYDDSNNIRIVSLASRTLKGAEKNYFTTELKLLAIVWSLQKFRTFIVGAKVLVQSDHKALSFLLNCRFLNSRLTRWMLAIQDYDLHMTYVRGKDNGLVDALSRLPGHQPDDGHELSIASIAIRAPSHRIVMRLKNIITEQKKDEKCALIVDRLRSGLEVGDYTCRGGILIKGKVGSQKIVIPRTLAYEVMLEIHEFYVHVGGKKVLQTFRESFYAEKARHIATNITRACDSCQRNKTYNQGNFVGVRAIIPEGPRDLLSVDFMGPYPTSVSGAPYILVCVDAFSKFVQLYPIRRADAPTTIRRIFNDYLPKYGPAKRIQTDHGTQFTSILWKRALRESNITHVLSSIRHPQSNIVERVNKENNA